MLNLSSSIQKSLGEEDSSDSDAGSEAGLEPETDRFGFILTNGLTTAHVGPSPDSVRRREAKWINIIVQWDHILMKKNNKVKVQCQKGIPASLRAKCWPLLCGAADRMKESKTLYQYLDSQPARQSWVDVIERDLDRQFPCHEMFLSRDGHGQRGLFRVLKAYTQYQPEEGYCQAQGPVAAVLLMNMPAEEAFWCLVQISEHYLPGYYSPLLEGVLFDAAMLMWVLKKTCPAAHKHLQRHEVEPLMFATDWLMCLFARHLPFNTLLRVWDLFFCYGVRVLLQVAVVLVSRVLGRAEQRKGCQGQMETLEKLRGVKDQVQDEDDAFIAEVCSVPLSARELEKQMEKEFIKWRRSSPSSTFDPRHRCHGFQMVWARARQNQEEQDRKERQKGNLSIPLSRSASTLSLSPYVLHGSLRKEVKGCTNEWSMGGKDTRRSSTELNFKKVKGAQVEGKTSEEWRKQAEIELGEENENKEPEQMVQNVKTEQIGETNVTQQVQTATDASATSEACRGTERGGKLDTPTVKIETEQQNAILEGGTASRGGTPDGEQRRHEFLSETDKKEESLTDSEDEMVNADGEQGSEQTLVPCVCIHLKDGTDLVADVRTEAEKPASDDITKETHEEAVQRSEEEHDAAATEPTRRIEDRFMTANSEEDEELTKTEETPTQFPPNEEKSTVAPPPKEAAPPQGEEVNFTSGSAVSPEDLKISEKQRTEQPEIQPTGEVEESAEPLRENAIRETPTGTRRSNTERNPQVRDKESLHVKEETAQSKDSLTRTSVLHCSRPSRDICIRKSYSYCGPRNGRRLSEDLFTMPRKTGQSHSVPHQAVAGHDKSHQKTKPDPTQSSEFSLSLSEGGESKRTGGQVQPSDPLKRFGLFRRARGDQPKKTEITTNRMQVPKILIQDFSDEAAREMPLKEVEEKLSSRERRRRRRERERKEKEEERLRKKRERETEKAREQGRKRLLTKGESSGMQKEKGSDEPHPTKTGSQTLRYSASYADSYF